MAKSGMITTRAIIIGIQLIIMAELLATFQEVPLITIVQAILEINHPQALPI
jgi:hypothetical protein